MSDNSITIKKATLTKFAVVGVAALMIASFFGGYNLGGSGKTVTIMQGGNNPAALPAGVQPLQIPSQQQQPAGAAPPIAAPVKVSSIALDSAPTQGKADAPVTFVEFSDFQCPFCGSFYSQTLHQLLTTYVDTGKIKFVYKQFPLDNLHPNAREAALASECANGQGKFWPYHNALFGNQTTWSNQDATQVVSTFKKYSSDLKLDTASFNSCLDSKKYASIVDKDSQEGSTYGVSGTPTFYIGNDKTGYTQLVGAQPFATFQQTIDNLTKQ
ncbi:MAG: DsbA family protein [Thermoproteota archaeon]|nr:DsbA family protein [Thermoproteota archaeon]